MPMQRLPRLLLTNSEFIPPFANDNIARVTSPAAVSGSTLTTSAPWSASNMAANGPATT